MTSKINVGLQQKIGQPNYGSIGASCSIEVPFDETEYEKPGLLVAKIQQAFDTCRKSVSTELATKDHREPSVPNKVGTNGESAVASRPRPASDAQVRAIMAIASKAGVKLASELKDRFGVGSPNELSLNQASQMIDELKSQLPAS